MMRHQTWREEKKSDWDEWRKNRSIKIIERRREFFDNLFVVDDVSGLKIGDIVEYEEQICLVSYISTIASNEIFQAKNTIVEDTRVAFPYVIISIKTGEIVNGYTSMDTLRNAIRGGFEK